MIGVDIVCLTIGRLVVAIGAISLAKSGVNYVVGTDTAKAVAQKLKPKRGWFHGK